MVQVRHGLEIPPVDGVTSLVEAGIYNNCSWRQVFTIPARGGRYLQYLLVEAGIYNTCSWRQAFTIPAHGGRYLQYVLIEAGIYKYLLVVAGTYSA